MSKLHLDTVTVRGTAAQMGAGQGEAFRPRIVDFMEMRLDAVQALLGDLGRGSLAELIQVGRRGYHLLKAWDPAGFAEHNAVARAAGVDPVVLFTTGNMTDMRDGVVLQERDRALGLSSGPADTEGCSLVLVPGPHTVDGATVVGQTWDLNPLDIDYVVGVHRVPDDAPESWSVTVAGCPSLVGMNEAGICTGTTNIKTWGVRDGVGYMNILHRVLGQTSFDGAASVIETAPRSGAHTYWVANAARVSDWETTPNSVIRRDGHAQPLWRTNHCLNHAHQILEGETASASSLMRHERIAATLTKHNMSVVRMQALFSDRSDGVDSVNRYPEDDQGTATNSVIVMVPERLELWACRGNADRGVWQQLRFEFSGNRA